MANLRIYTFGCRLNKAESELIRQQLEPLKRDKLLILINTCAITAKAEQQTRQFFRKLRRQNPKATIIAAGCWAQLQLNRYGNKSELNQVLKDFKIDRLISNEAKQAFIGKIYLPSQTS